jgi:hypothetical protein
MFFRDNQINIRNDGEYMVKGYVLIEAVDGVQLLALQFVYLGVIN